MADIGKYKAHRKMMQDPERKKAYIDAMKRKRKDTASNQTITKPSRSMMMDTTTYPLGQDPQFDDKLIYKPGPEDSKEFKRLKELMERKKAKVKVKRAMGGIAGVL